MRKGVIISVCVVGVVVAIIAMFDPNPTLAAISISIAASSALLWYVSDSIDKKILQVSESINKRVDDLRDDVKEIRDDTKEIRDDTKGIRDDVREIGQELKSHKHP